MSSVRKYLWAIPSFIPLINGVGFIHLGNKFNNTNWIIEGIIYEIPWIFAIFVANKDPMFKFAYVMYTIGILRTFWILAKYPDEYVEIKKLNDKLNNVKDNVTGKTSQDDSNGCSCCYGMSILIVILFIIFVIF